MVTESTEETSSSLLSNPHHQKSRKRRVEMNQRYKVVGEQHPIHEHQPDNEIIARQIDLAAEGLPKYVPKQLTDLYYLSSENALSIVNFILTQKTEISNLLSNAIKFTTEGTILVSVERGKNDNSVIVSVKDTGQGIDPSILPRLFTKFATKSHKGTGLGLFISKGIIEAHGGKIWGENNGDGIGATFSFSLPLV